jgi:hypothetical protein
LPIAVSHCLVTVKYTRSRNRIRFVVTSYIYISSSNQHAPSFFSTRTATPVWDSSQDAALPSKDSWPHAFGGPHHLKGFSPSPLEGYNIKARTSSWPTFLFFRVDFLFCIRDFHVSNVRCFHTQPHYWERTASVCIIHLCSVFARPPTLSSCISFLSISLFSPLWSVQHYVLSIWRPIC